VKTLAQLEEEAAAELGIREYPGYTGAFTRRQAAGALDNGTTVVKVAHDEGGDLHPDGSEGAILGSIRAAGLGVMYFVEWDATPGVATAVVEAKIRPR